MTKKRKQHVSPGDSANTVDAATNRIGSGKVGHVQQSVHQEVDLVSFYGGYGSKTGLNLIYRLLRHVRYRPFTDNHERLVSTGHTFISYNSKKM